MESDNTISQRGTPLVIRDIITMGEVNGMMEPQNTIEESGSRMVFVEIKYPIINGIITGVINCCESASESTALPMAAMIEL